jgi:NAD(P)-dependent dehydrogenase (short-subunit alcohol dehydrogenase family)
MSYREKTMTKTILIVGGTSGIGSAITKRLIEAGHQLHVISRNSPAEPLEGVEYHQGDVLDDSLDLESLETLDGLVYCPGSINLKPFQQLSGKEFSKDFEINVLGAVNILRKTEKRLKKSGNGSVVLFSTVAVGQGMPYHSSTAAAKGAVEGMARSLASEWAPKVRVNVIAPSITDTPMASQILKNDERRESSAKRHPLNRVGQPEDIAAMASFLLSDDSSWMSGQTLGIDGGMSTLRGL